MAVNSERCPELYSVAKDLGFRWYSGSQPPTFELTAAIAYLQCLATLRIAEAAEYRNDCELDERQ